MWLYIINIIVGEFIFQVEEENMKIKKLVDKVEINEDIKAECCCHDCATWKWTGKSCSRVKGCYEKCVWTAKTTKWW